MEGAVFEIASAVERGIVDQAKYIGALATAIFGAIAALRLQFMLSSKAVRWSLAFWVAAGLAIPTIGLVVAISGLMIELVPVLYAFPFDTKDEFSGQDFDGTRINVLKHYSRIQLLLFFGFFLSSGAFALRNFVGLPDTTSQGDK